MMDLIYKILAVETDVFYIIIAVSVIAALLKRELLGSDLLALAAVPIYITVSLIGLYVFRYNYMVVVSDHQIEAVIAASFGITVSFLCILVIMDFFRTLTNWQVQRNIKTRNLDRDTNAKKPKAG